MWNIFKILNLLSVFISAYWWVTANFPVLLLTLFINIAMIPCLGLIPMQFRFDRHTGKIILAFLLMVIWAVYNQSVGMGIGLILSYLPIFYLIALPRDYQADLLRFVTKWLAIPLIPALIIHWFLFVIPLPPAGSFIMEGYEPFDNYIFMIKTTVDNGLFVRFSAFFPEPGHLSMVCVFLMMANRFEFKRQPWLWVILTAVVFSFSLAGYILTLTGYILLKINSFGKGLALCAVLIAFIIGVMNFAEEDNPVNQLIIERLKYDQAKGIEGNNRFFNNTDFEYDRALKNGDFMTGVSHNRNMELISGAGFKIYILQHGLIGLILVFALYISLIPSDPNWHYSLSFLFIVILCFVQNAYPGWYAWLCPYVLGLYINRKTESAQPQLHI